MVFHTDTIVALSTPPGRGGIGVIRISGPNSLDILRTLVASESFNPQPNLLKLRSLIDPSTGEMLDQALVCYFKAPHSFTGEDLVELHCYASTLGAGSLGRRHTELIVCDSVHSQKIEKAFRKFFRNYHRMINLSA